MDKPLVQQLQQIEALKNVPVSQLQWLLSKGECLSFKKGDHVFRKGEPINKMHIILKGSFILKIEQNGQYRVIGSLDQQSISGALPYSRASTATGTAEATSDSSVVALDKSYFQEMIHDHHELTTALVHVMSTRIRNFTKMQQQNDKMMALGKLSAGLAHELNNPSAAVVRSAQTLRKHLSLLPESFKNVISIRMDDEQVDVVNNILFKKIGEGIKEYSLMNKTEREDEVAEWLETVGFEDGYDFAENFVDFGFETSDFDVIAERVPSKDLKAVLGWLNQVMTTEKLVMEIEDASQRINDLVGSVKSYTHMDQATERQEVDIHKGINNTLVMLNHKLKRANIEVIKNYEQDLVKPCIYVSEMNQVWTNLIDNAIDALENAAERKLEIETRQDGSLIKITITDSGPGIPESVIDNIFDPFYTTKSIGKGTGLGLDVVQQVISQHNGSINVESTPGRTAFKICIPIR